MTQKVLSKANVPLPWSEMIRNLFEWTGRWCVRVRNDIKHERFTRETGC